MTITALPTPPSRQDPDNFADRADALVAALVTFVTEANALQEDVNAKQTTASGAATTATTKAGEAASARDIALAATNYKGLWSSLSGALAVPASVFHGSSVWMLKENVASVGAEVPGVSSKWLNVTPASGLGTAAYASATDFQPAIGALTGLLQSAGGGTISAATAAQIVAAIGAVYVANASHATAADEADLAIAIMDGAVSSAAKIANSIITWSKMAAMNTAKLIGRSAGGAGSPEEISIGSGLSLTAGALSCTVPTTTVNGVSGPVSNGNVAAAAIAGGASAAHSHPYLGTDHASAIGAMGCFMSQANSGTSTALHFPSGNAELSGTWRILQASASFLADPLGTGTGYWYNVTAQRIA